MKASKYPKLKALIMENGITYTELSKKLNLVNCTVCHKINGNNPITVEEAKILCKLLKKKFEELF